MIKQFQIEKNIQTEKTLKRLKLNLNFVAENRKLKNANKKLENTILLSSKNRLLKSLIFYGQNEVGKSQIYQDLKNFRDFITNGTLKSDFFNASLRFFIKIDNEIIESEINIHFQNDKILKEELFIFNQNRKTKIYSRKEQSFYFNQKFTSENLRHFSKFINSDELFISKVAQNHFFESYEKLNIYFTVYNFIKNDYLFDNSENLDKNIFIENYDLLLEFIKLANLNINQFENPYEFYEDLQNASSGTKEFVFTLAKIFKCQTSGQILFLDDFAKNLHPILAKFLVKIIHSAKNLQVLMTSNCTSILDTKLFRIDQINFLDFDDYSSLLNKRLFDFKDFRENMNAEKCYLQGRFSATPFIIVSENTIGKLLERVRG